MELRLRALARRDWELHCSAGEQSVQRAVSRHGASDRDAGGDADNHRYDRHDHLENLRERRLASRLWHGSGYYPLQSALQDSGQGTMSHSVTLTGLTPGTTYHYRINSRDAAGNLASLADAKFTTAAGGGGTLTGPGAKVAGRWRRITIPAARAAMLRSPAAPARALTLRSPAAPPRAAALLWAPAVHPELARSRHRMLPHRSRC